MRGVAAFGGLMLAIGVPAVTAAEQFQVHLQVEESAGVARRAEPISGGIPLPVGRFRSGQPFALFRQGGPEVACQVLPLVVERDGTLRWILLDFQDDVAAGATNHYVLRPVRPAVGPGRTLQVRETTDGVVLDTGSIQLEVSKVEPFGLFASVRSAEGPVVAGGRASYVQYVGRRSWDDPAPWQKRSFVAGPPDAVKVVYRGPLRATLEVAGPFAGDPAGMGYRAWITAWAGSSRVWVKYKLCNSNPDRYTAIPVGGAAITLHLGSPPESVLVGASRPLRFGPDGWIHQGLHLYHTYQEVTGAVRAGSGPRTLWTGSGRADRPAGWIATSGPGGVFVCDRLFAEDPARRLEVSGGELVIECVATRFDGPRDRKFNRDRPVGQPWMADPFWLFDCSHHSSEYLFDFRPPSDPGQLNKSALAAHNRLWALAPGEYYSRCEAIGCGRFGTLEDELAAYRRWGWTWDPKRVPDQSRPQPNAFVAWEDNHYESEADSVQGLVLMYLRTGQRGWFDQAEAWARYHMDLQAWRTDGWRWKDGAVWFPSGGPQGTRPVRAGWNFQWGPNWGQREASRDCADLWKAARGKSCYCHFYGSGLADYYCLTGDPDALQAARDNVEQKENEFRVHRRFQPGETPVGSIRGFGRGFEVMVRVLMADPQNEPLRAACRLAARTLWQSPWLDERGFHPSRIGGGFGGMSAKLLSPPIRRWMDQHGITFTTEGDTVDRLMKGDRQWPVRCMGGTWQHIYIQNGADLYARYFGDEDMRDFVIAFAQLSARYMLSPKCRQTWYYTYFDVPDLGMVFDPWAFEHTDTEDGQGCVHSGWYTRFYPDACAKGFSLTGEKDLLEHARLFWYYGSKRGYRSKALAGAENEVVRFADHTPPKDDTVLETARLFWEASHPRTDDQPPEAIRDLRVRRLGGGRAEVRFTAPVDRGGGRVVGYQVKVSRLPIVPYQSWDFARDEGKRRNWWRAANCHGEPAPSPPGTEECFVVSGIPQAEELYFAIRSFDDSHNRSPISNLATP